MNHCARLTQWGDDDDLGLLLKIAPYVIYKRGGFGDWAQFVEVFGMPIRVGKYNSMDEASKRMLIRAFETMGAAPYLVVPKDSEVETTLMSGKQDGKLYDDFRQACNEEILIAILGQTMTTQDGASLSQSKVHLAVQEKKHRADRRFVIRQLNERLLPLLEARGYPVSGGRFSFVDKKDEISTEEIIALSKVMPIPCSWVRTSRGIPEPEKGEPVLQSTEPTSPATPTPPTDDDDDDDNDDLIKNSDRTLWQRIKSFFGLAPTGSGAGIIRMKDGDSVDQTVIKQVWNGERSFSPELFRYLSDNFLKAIQTGFKGSSSGVQNADVGITYQAPDDVFRTALELNIFHFSAAKTIAEIRALNQILQESKTYGEFRDKAAKVTGKFNRVWQKTEYDTAILTAESMDNYRRLKSQTKVFPYWQYKTVEDDRVRVWHRRLDNIVLPSNDKNWNDIYPPNGWRCRCRVRGLMAHQVTKEQLQKSEKIVAEYKKSAEWAQIKAQGWGVNRCAMAQIYTENEFYIQHFPHQAQRLLTALTSDKWGLPSVAKLSKEAKEDMPLIEIERKGNTKPWKYRTEEQKKSKEIQYQIWDRYNGGYDKNDTITLKDYRGRDITLKFSDFENHTTRKGRSNRIKYWDAMLETLKAPDEVWINNHKEGGNDGNNGKHKENVNEKPDEDSSEDIDGDSKNKSKEMPKITFDVYCLIKYYKDVALCVNLQLKDNRLMLTTWYPMETNVNRPETVENPDGTTKQVFKNKRKTIWDKRRFGLLVYLKE